MSFILIASILLTPFSCMLELEDEEDTLNCGIEIKVQPPGKTLKTLSLLSGGEKAFVRWNSSIAPTLTVPNPLISRFNSFTRLEAFASLSSSILCSTGTGTHGHGPAA